jgi:hypothetical protein
MRLEAQDITKPIIGAAYEVPNVLGEGSTREVFPKKVDAARHVG